MKRKLIKKDRNLVIRVSKRDEERIEYLRKHYEMTASELIRNLIMNAEREIKNG